MGCSWMPLNYLQQPPRLRPLPHFREQPGQVLICRQRVRMPAAKLQFLPRRDLFVKLPRLLLLLDRACCLIQQARLARLGLQCLKVSSAHLRRSARHDLHVAAHCQHDAIEKHQSTRHLGQWIKGYLLEQQTRLLVFLHADQK